MSNERAQSVHSVSIFVPEAFSQAANRLRSALANAIALVPQAHCDETLGSKLDRREIDDAASACFDLIAGLPTPPTEPAGDVEKVAKAIWAIQREDLDKCDMDLEDVGDHYDTEKMARAAIAAMQPGSGEAASGAVSDAKLAATARKALGEWLAWPDAPRDGAAPVDNEKTESWLRGLPNRLGTGVAPASGEPVPERHELAAKAVEDADRIAERIRAGGYRASIANVETLLKHVRKLADAAPAEPATNPCKLPADVARLVVAGRIVWERIAFDAMPDADEIKELDRALEAFSARVPYEDEPDDFAETAKSTEPASEAGEHPNAMDWRNRAERAEAECAELRDDKARLDYLDRCNAALNAHYGTSYRWKMIQSHNVNRLMLGHWQVDLYDNEASGLPSCRAAIDERMREARA